MKREIKIQLNKSDGNFHQIILKDVIKFSTHNNMRLRGFMHPQHVICAFFENKPPFPIANFYSLEARNNMALNLIHGIDTITYNDFYEESLNNSEIIELIKYSSVGTFSKYFKNETNRLMKLHSMNSHLDLLNLDIFKSMEQRLILNLIHGRYVGNRYLPSPEDMCSTLRIPSTIIKYGISPLQFFKYLVHEKDS